MNRELQEKRTLVELARKFGQEPSPRLLEDIAILEQEEATREQRNQELRSRIAQDITEIFGAAAVNELVQPSPLPVTEDTAEPEPESDPEPAVEPERLTDAVSKYIKNSVRESTLVNPEPVLAQPQKDLEREIKYLREWVSRIAATGPGGGAGSQNTLDSETTFVTTNYAIKSKDYYVGVSSNTSITIVLPSNTKNGRQLVIKDESSNAQNNPITVLGTVDNDAGGFVVQINNGAIQLIYRNGWRII